MTLLAMIGAGVGFGGWIFKLGGRNKEIDAMRDDLAALKRTRTDERDADRKEREAFQIAINAGLTVARTSLTEHEKICAQTFATKVELLALEERTNKGMDRIVDRLEQISGRLEAIGDMIVKSLAERRAP